MKIGEIKLMKTALFIGRFAPAHKGHIEAILKMLESYDRLVIGLGSCYEVGTKRHPFLAIFREKMLRMSIAEGGGDLSKIDIVHIQDHERFDDWLDDVLQVCDKHNVTHFITGNKEDILDVLDEKGKKLPFEFVNPEETSSVPYHATDLRNAILKGDYDKFAEIASFGTQMLLGSINGFNGLRYALEDSGRTFYKGRQTVDVVFTLQDTIYPKSNKPYLKNYVLCGYRDSSKLDFPNYLGLVGDEIKKFESPIDAAVRALSEKTGIEAVVKSNLTEPAVISLKSDHGDILSELRFLDLYNNDKLAGRQGGSSQAFQINLNCKPNEFDKALSGSGFKFKPVCEVLEEGLAYQQTDMLKDAVSRIEHYAQ
ncbi:MAG: hypothetical protein HFI85_05395 [Clostridia bacterium]|jgi:nicotinamide-nucleotide adenylyltransferase|nr:hypothetical protein [Clostridia bacterium]